MYVRALAIGIIVVLLGLSGAASSWAHGAARGRASEHALRNAETRILGADHAAGHARGRRLERRSRARWRRLSPGRRHRILERRRHYVAQVATAGEPATDGRWQGQVEIPVLGVHAALLPTGKVMWFNRLDAGTSDNEAAAYLWDPSKPAGDPGAIRQVTPPVNPETGRPVNLFCAGQSLLADGQLLVTGGNLAYASATSDYKGLNRIYTFDPWSEQWTEQPRMAHGRWYPTQTLLPDGRTMIVAGRDETGDASDATNTDIELFSPPATRGGQGTVNKVAEYGSSLIGSPAKPAYYPHWIVMPNGNVLNAGPRREESWALNFTRAALSSADRPSWAREHLYGTGVLLPGGPQGSTRVAQIGGFGWFPGAPDSASQREATATSEIFDEAHPTAAPTPGPSLVQARAHHNTVLLPDGSMVSVGGGYGNRDGDLRLGGPEHLAIELWDPVTETWRLGPVQLYKRAYHSTALLLPDGRVVSAGDDRDPTKAPTRRTDVAEIYEPPYLSAPGPRPAITSAPESVSWNQSFAVQTSSPVARAVLMAPGATTHANDMQQRHVELRMTPSPSGTGAELVAPPNANVAPPGWYMLFALSPSGKPSIAKWIKLGESIPLSPAPPSPSASHLPSATTTATPTPTPSTVSSPSPEDTTSPRLSIKSLSRKLGRVVKKGLPLLITTNEGVHARGTLFVKRAAARNLGLTRPVIGPIRVGRVERTLPSGRSTVRVGLMDRARVAIRHARKVTLQLSVTVTDSSGNRAGHTDVVVLKR